MNTEELKHCMIPGCDKELPEGTKLPVCDYHKDKAKDGFKWVGATTAAFIGGLVIHFVQTSDNLATDNPAQTQEGEFFEERDDQDSSNA